MFKKLKNFDLFGTKKIRKIEEEKKELKEGKQQLKDKIKKLSNRIEYRDNHAKTLVEKIRKNELEIKKNELEIEKIYEANNINLNIINGFLAGVEGAIRNMQEDFIDNEKIKSLEEFISTAEK